LVIYHPEHDSRVLILTEFKPHGGKLEGACSKLLDQMHAIRCPFGAVCAMHADKSDAHLPRFKQQTEDAGNTWHCAEAKLTIGVSKSYSRYYVFACGLRLHN
jgi:phage replication-related protein YjqB (UPF0714/DUF867 family)